MSPVPAIVILGSSALKLAEKIRAALGEAEIHGLAARGGDTDASFTEAMPHIAALFGEGRPIIGVVAERDPAAKTIGSCARAPARD